MRRNMKLSFIVLTVLCIIIMCNVAFAEITPENVAVNSYINVDLNDGGEYYDYCTYKSYKIEVPSTGTLVIYGDLSANSWTDLKLYNSDMQLLLDSDNRWKNNNVNVMRNISMPLLVTKGTYYLAISNREDFGHLNGKIFVKYSTSKISNCNSTLKGQLYRNETITYQVKVPYTGYFYLKGSFVASDRQDIEILDANGQILDNDGEDDWYSNGATGLMDLKFKTKKINAGTYYVKIKNKNEGNLTYNISLRTFISSTSLKVNKTSLILKRGQSYQLKATMGPTKTTDKLTWSSNNKKIATVSNTGKVIAKSKGTVYIKVKTTSGLVKQVKVVVK